MFFALTWISHGAGPAGRLKSIERAATSTPAFFADDARDAALEAEACFAAAEEAVLATDAGRL